MTDEQRDLLHYLGRRARTSAERGLLGDFATLLRVQDIFDRYCREGNRPTHEEAKAWLESLGWKPHPLANLLREWGYDESNPR